MYRLFNVIFVLCSLSTFSLTGAPKDSIDLMIGQMIMIGIGDFNEVNIRETIFDEIKKGKVGGVVLYEKNILFENPKPELALLVNYLQKDAKIPMFISIDEEGGFVSRMKARYGFPKNVSAQHLGNLDNLDSTRHYARQTASLLDSFGINMNYAPVVDVNLNRENPVIGSIERSYSTEYDKVIKHAYQVVDMHQRQRVISVLKHFPGHGSSKNDTHMGLTDVTSTWQIEELYPYSTLIDSGIVKAVMTAHIVNKVLDKSKKPATLSKHVIDKLLREFLGFDGVIISDDLQMGAIRNEFGLKDAIKMSIEAGIDILMFANNVKDYELVSASTVHAIIKNLLSEGIITRERIYESYQRIMKLKKEFHICGNKYYRSIKTKLEAHR